jgi:hypothetical protein
METITITKNQLKSQQFWKNAHGFLRGINQRLVSFEKNFFFSKINALACGMCACVLLTASLLSDYWIYSNGIRQGLWRLCTADTATASVKYKCDRITITCKSMCP